MSNFSNLINCLCTHHFSLSLPHTNTHKHTHTHSLSRKKIGSSLKNGRQFMLPCTKVLQRTRNNLGKKFQLKINDFSGLYVEIFFKNQKKKKRLKCPDTKIFESWRRSGLVIYISNWRLAVQISPPFPQRT